MPSKKPNILILWGDDIGWWNISYNSRGQMGYRTPNIDRVANEGVAFTDYYAQQSCTAGRAAFICGQNPVRTGLTKVGMPGADLGLSGEDPTIADLLKPLGYMTGQFGKNHLGDKDEFLPTAHGFDEFFGNLYHLNAEEEPEDSDYPKDPEFDILEDSEQLRAPPARSHRYAYLRVREYCRNRLIQLMREGAGELAECRGSDGSSELEAVRFPFLLRPLPIRNVEMRNDGARGVAKRRYPLVEPADIVLRGQRIFVLEKARRSC